MNLIRKLYQRVIPLSVRTWIAHARSQILSKNRLTLPRKRHGRAISNFERGIKPAPKTIPTEIDTILKQLALLPAYWHQVGTLDIHVLRAIVRHILDIPTPITLSMETGCGKSSLLLSHLSKNHKIFTISGANDSLTKVLESPLLNRTAIEVIDGPSQITLPSYKFEHKIQVALLDGPHAYPAPDLEYYYVYPHLDGGGLLIVDDIHIPSVFNMFEVIAFDKMFELIEVVEATAFFRRTDSPTFDPLMGSWIYHRYNYENAPDRLHTKADEMLKKPEIFKQ
jgi:hypothetical protein